MSAWFREVAILSLDSRRRPAMELPPPNGLVTLLTDFGLRDPYVGIVKGMVKRQNPRAEVLDVCHGVPPQDVAVGALFVRAMVQRFPPGTVHVAVVDPGVGGERKALAVCAHECYWIGPDNGLLSAALPGPGHDADAREVDMAHLRGIPCSATFHGRDVFGPIAGMLSGRKVGFPAIGPRAARFQVLARHEGPAHKVLFVDHYGNLVTSLSAAEAAARKVTGLRVAGRFAPLRRTYSDAPAGEVLALVNSYDLVEIALCCGRADAALGCSPGAAVEVVTGGSA